MGTLGDKIGEGVVRRWPLTNSFCLLGVLTSVPILVKIDQGMQPWECSQTDRQSDWPKQTDFMICPMLYAIAMGQIINGIETDRLWELPASADVNDSLDNAVTVIVNEAQWSALIGDRQSKLVVIDETHLYFTQTLTPMENCSSFLY